MTDCRREVERRSEAKKHRVVDDYRKRPEYREEQLELFRL